MKIVIIHGQAHKGISYTMTRTILERLRAETSEVREFFLPKDGPEFCYGCNACFIKGETFCPSADKVQPIAEAIEWADVIMLSTPNYVMGMSGAMKNLMDHLAYRWVTHRPHPSMYRKVGIAVCSSAGAPPMGVTWALSSKLKWMGVPTVYTLPFVSNAMTVADIKEKKRRQMDRKAVRIAKAVRRKAGHVSASLRGRVFFLLMRKMQMSPDAAWNPTDQGWWRDHGWTGKTRPWKPDR